MALVIRAKNEAQDIVACCEDVVVAEGNWYFKPDKVNMQYLTKTDRIYNCPYKGVAYWYDFNAPDIHAENVAWIYETPKSGWDHIAGRIAFYARETSATVASTEALTEA